MDREIIYNRKLSAMPSEYRYVLQMSGYCLTAAGIFDYCLLMELGEAPIILSLGEVLWLVEKKGIGPYELVTYACLAQADQQRQADEYLGSHPDANDEGSDNYA